MNGRDRINAVLKGTQPDRVPIFPKWAPGTVMSIPGMHIRDFMEDPEKMAAAIIAAAEKFGYDAVGITTDIANEGMAIGSIYERPLDDTSHLVKYFLDDIEEYEKVVVTNPWDREPTKTILKAAEIVKKRCGDQLYITAWCNGPLNVAGQLLPMQEMMVATITDPESLHELLERCLAYSMNYVKYLAETGVDAISFGHATASNNVISPEAYMEFAFPYETRLIEQIHQQGVKSITHICGKIDKTIEMITQTKTDIIDVDSVNDIYSLRDRTTAVVRGNISPVLLVKGSPEEVYQQTLNLVQRMGDEGRFILGSGCEIPVTVPAENMKAFVEAGRAYSK